jgi:methionine-rich copper-binding protein CopC
MNHRPAAATAVLSLLLAALLPAAVAAHSELVVSDPADGAILTGPPLEISGDFSEELDATRSVMELRAPGLVVLATGRVPEGGPPTRMAIVGLPALDPGTYEVRWTTVTADDDGVERGTFAFTVVAATPSPSPIAAPSSRPAPTGPPSAPPAAPSAPSPAPGTEAGSTTGELLVPLAVLAVILAGGAAWLLRRRR